MDIDIVLPHHLNADEICELGQLAEANGIRTIWVSSLINSHDPYANLTPAARATKRIGVGAIAVNPFDTHPVRIATSIFTLNEMAKGRAKVIIGGGGEALMALGLPPTRRVRAVRECVEILKAASPETPLDYKGELYQVTNYRPAWAKAEPPEIYVAANKPQMLKMCARQSDGVMMSDLPPTISKERIGWVKDHLQEFGREAAPFRFSNYVAWHVYEDEQAARNEAAMWMGYRGLFRDWVITTFMSQEDYDIIEAHKTEIYQMPFKGTHSVPGFPQRIMDELIDNITLAGTPDDLDRIIEHLAELKQAGMDEIALELHQQPDVSIKLIGEKVIPALH